MADSPSAVAGSVRWAGAQRDVLGLALHVLDKRDERPHTPERHDEAKVRFAFADETIEALGFFSTGHRGIFTPRDADVHLHARLSGGRVVGHVDDLALGAGGSLWLPRSRGGKDRPA